MVEEGPPLFFLFPCPHYVIFLLFAQVPPRLFDLPCPSPPPPCADQPLIANPEEARALAKQIEKVSVQCVMCGEVSVVWGAFASALE